MKFAPSTLGTRHARMKAEGCIPSTHWKARIDEAVVMRNSVFLAKTWPPKIYVVLEQSFGANIERRANLSSYFGIKTFRPLSNLA